jgi:ribosome-binding ATPase YchF (GTP1/OBG family)
MMGVAEPALPRLVRLVYEQLRLQVFYTISDEVKAWLLPKGGTALDAAATIHSDLARGSSAQRSATPTRCWQQAAGKRRTKRARCSWWARSM